MGKKKTKGEYNDFLEDIRYQTNNDVRTTLQSTSTLSRTVSPSSHHRTPSKPTKNPPLTHFLCLPLTTPETRPKFASALAKLRSDVATLTAVPPAAVRPPGTLHLTLGVMSLSPTELAAATTHLLDLDVAQLLRGITTQAIAEQARDSPSVSENGGAMANPPVGTAASADPGVLSVRLSGLVPMQRREGTSVLYAQPGEEMGRLGRFAESVRRGFEEGGWVVKDERGLRLHATVLNTIYAKGKGRRAGRPEKGVEGGESGSVDGEEKRKPDAKSWMRFDASTLIDAYEDFVWADDVRIDRVQICKMGAKKILHEETGEVVDEEYEVVAEKRI